MSVPKIFLDTDPGGDDAFTFFWLLSLVSQGLAEVVAITTAAGNVSVEQTFANASQLLGLVGRPEISLGRGVALAEHSQDATHIHGKDGIGNLTTTLPAPTHDFHAAPAADDLLIEHLNQAPGEITLVAIAPLTNLAAAEKKSPGILQKAKEIVIMAGAFHASGNVTPQAEFNVWFNPEAAATVLQSRDDTVVIPLDLTRNLIFTRELAQAVSQVNGEGAIAQFLQPLCEFMIGTAQGYRETRGIPGFLVHDAATLGYLFYPETLMLRRAKVTVETQGQCRGQTLMDNRHTAKLGSNTWVALEIDSVGFFTSFVEDLKSLIRTN